MIMLLEYTPGLEMGSDKITFDNPYQGLLFHWIIKDFFCTGVMKGYFKISGLDNEQEVELTQCRRAFLSSEAKMTELFAFLNSKNLLTPPLFSNHFFKYSENPNLLPGDRKHENQVQEQREGYELDEEQEEGEEDGRHGGEDDDDGETN